MSNQPPKGKFVVISTPIGNLKDISLRAIDALKTVDLLFCEDTRTTQKLLSHLDIKVPLHIYNDQSTEKDRASILKALAMGKNVGLVSDAGTPLISDPGYKLVRQCHVENIEVDGIPGPAACIHALVLSGLPTNEFHFCGFLPPKEKEKRDKILSLSTIPGTLIFYETAPKLLSTLQLLHDVLGNRPAVLARELTKKFQEVFHHTLGDFVSLFEKETRPKGEIVLLVEGAKASQKISFSGKEDIMKKIGQALGNKEASHLLSTLLNQPRKDIYQTLIQNEND